MPHPTKDQANEVVTILNCLMHRHPNLVRVDLAGSQLQGYKVLITLKDPGGKWPETVNGVKVETVALSNSTPIPAQKANSGQTAAD